MTRPDIIFAVEVLSRFMHQLRETHWLTAMRVLAYIKSCSGKGLVYRKHGYVHISRYSDLGCIGGNKKFTIGCCTFIGGNLVTWRKSKMSRSNAEAEYRAMAQQHARWCG